MNILVDKLSVGSLQTNCYVVCDKKTNECLIIDPGDEGEFIAQKVLSRGTPTGIVITHGHFDHMIGAFELQELFHIPTYFHKTDDFLRLRMRETAKHFLGMHVIEPPPHISNYVKNSDFIHVGSIAFRVMETPGHTPGSISLYCDDDDTLFSGDVLFSDGSVGNWKHSYGDKKKLDESVLMILALPEQTIIYPGHGEECSVGDLKTILKL